MLKIFWTAKLLSIKLTAKSSPLNLFQAMNKNSK